MPQILEVTSTERVLRWPFADRWFENFAAINVPLRPPGKRALVYAGGDASLQFDQVENAPPGLRSFWSN